MRYNIFFQWQLAWPYMCHYCSASINCCNYHWWSGSRGSSCGCDCHCHIDHCPCGKPSQSKTLHSAGHQQVRPKHLIARMLYYWCMYSLMRTMRDIAIISTSKHHWNVKWFVVAVCIHQKLWFLENSSISANYNIVFDTCTGPAGMLTCTIPLLQEGTSWLESCC